MMTPTVDLDSAALAVRIGAAVIAGAILGIDREIKNKPAGLRTHALVSIGSAIAVLVAVGSSPGNADAESRVIQGVITGIGFLGAGVIMQYENERRVEGLTTAASIWVAAGLGMACGAGLVELVLVGLFAAVVVMVGGEAVERRLNKSSGNVLTPEERDRR